jgi:hypothetical protein
MKKGFQDFLAVGKIEESEEVIEGFVANCEKGRKGGRDVDSWLKFLSDSGNLLLKFFFGDGA